MRDSTNDHSRQVQAFEQWLADSPVKPRPGLLGRVRDRIAEEDRTIDQTIDALFSRDVSRNDPQMAAKVRDRIGRKPTPDKVVWYQWLTPLAAALVLGVAFFSFQNKAPYQDTPLPDRVNHVVAAPSAFSDDPEITRIFALASNLQGTSGMSRLQSMDDLAFLFE